MLKSEVLKRLKELSSPKISDYESSHHEADGLIAEFLASLGHPDIANEYYKVGKWYA